MSRPTRSMVMLAFAAVTFLTIGRVPRPVEPRLRDAEVMAVVDAETGP